MHKNTKADTHQGCDTCREEQIQINIVAEGTVMNTLSLIRAVDSMNAITRYTHSYS
jgi:hypothetical protein